MYTAHNALKTLERQTDKHLKTVKSSTSNLRKQDELVTTPGSAMNLPNFDNANEKSSSTTVGESCAINVIRGTFKRSEPGAGAKRTSAKLLLDGCETQKRTTRTRRCRWLPLHSRVLARTPAYGSYGDNRRGKRRRFGTQQPQPILMTTPG